VLSYLNVLLAARSFKARDTDSKNRLKRKSLIRVPKTQLPFPNKWLRAGLVVERTQASGNSDVRRGPLIGLKSKDEDYELTAYWLSPGSREATFVFAVTFKF
jgi:hypothetical protein